MEDNTFINIPKNWEIVKLGDNSISKNMYYGITAKSSDESKNLKMLRTTDIKNYSVDWENIPHCEITEEKKDIEKYFLQKNDIIIARAGSTGVSVLVPKNSNNTIFGSYLIKVQLKEKLFPKYSHYFFQSNIYWDHIERHQAGSTMKNINLKILKFLKIPLPPLPEQKKIAEILTTVDSAIQKSDEIIEKTERLKKGLMQTLLTKGIGHKEFKDTKIGRIPKEWEIKKLEKVCEKIQSGGTPLTSKKEYYNGKIPFVKIEDITSAKKYITKTSINITKNGLENSSSWLVPKKSLLLAIYGSLGKVTINNIELATNQAILGIIFDNENAYVEFVYYKLLNTNLEKYAKKSTQANLTAKIIRNLKIPLPPISEQQKIVEILSTVDKKLELERKRKKKLERIKKGLMNDLLTGKKRVKVN